MRFLPKADCLLKWKAKCLTCSEIQEGLRKVFPFQKQKIEMSGHVLIPVSSNLLLKMNR